MKIELILLGVIGLVILIDNLNKKRKKSKSLEVSIPINSQAFKAKYFIRISFFLLVIFSCVYFYHFFPKKVVDNINLLISTKKYEDAFKKIANYKTIYGEKVFSDLLESKIHEDRISFFSNSINFDGIRKREEGLDSLKQLGKFYDSYSDFNLKIGEIKKEIENKYRIFNFQYNIAKNIFLYYYIGEDSSTYIGDRIVFRAKQDSIKNILELKLKNARDFAFDERNTKYLRSSIILDAETSLITGELEPLNKILAFDDFGSLEIKIIEKFLVKLNSTNVRYFGKKNDERKMYFDFARKVRYKIDKRWYSDKVLIEEIISGDLIDDDLFTQNAITAFKVAFGNKKISKKRWSAMQEIIPKYRKMNLDKYSISYWINFYWLKSTIYLNSDPNVSLDALYNIENLLSNKISEGNKSDLLKDLLSGVLYRIANIKSEKDDVKGALNIYKRAKKLYDFKGKEINDKKAAPNYSNILYKIFQHKWNTKPYGNKNGACQDLKLAAKINAEGYYDYYIKMCVKP